MLIPTKSQFFLIHGYLPTRIKTFGYPSVLQGEMRFKEMLCVEETLGLSGMEVLDLPDGELKKLNPIKIEDVIESHINKIKPDVVVTCAVHGVSGFHDHLVTHAVVKRVFF